MVTPCPQCRAGRRRARARCRSSHTTGKRGWRWAGWTRWLRSTRRFWRTPHRRRGPAMRRRTRAPCRIRRISISTKHKLDSKAVIWGRRTGTSRVRLHTRDTRDRHRRKEEEMRGTGAITRMGVRRNRKNSVRMEEEERVGTGTGSSSRTRRIRLTRRRRARVTSRRSIISRLLASCRVRGHHRHSSSRGSGQAFRPSGGSRCRVLGGIREEFAPLILVLFFGRLLLRQELGIGMLRGHLALNFVWFLYPVTRFWRLFVFLQAVSTALKISTQSHISEDSKSNGVIFVCPYRLARTFTYFVPKGILIVLRYV